ncbi:MAG: ABC transporter permease [Chloroflexota bacterium]|nr:MAG: ABC transporter permease [Chloroflexota bacterium]
MNAEGRVYKATGIKLFWRMLLARAYPRFVSPIREKSWLFFETFLPLMATSAYVFVYKAVDAPPEFIGFVVIGGTMSAFWLNVLFGMAMQLYWDKEIGNLDAYILSPGPIMAILAGMALGGMVVAASRAVFVLVIASLAFQVTYTISSLPLLILVFLLTLLALYGMGMMFAAVYLAAGRDAWQINSLFQEPIYFISGFYFPVKTLGFWFAAAASIIPLTLGLDAMRQILFSGDPALGFLPVEVEILLLIVLSVVFLAVSQWALVTLERIGRRDGRIIERRR